MLVALASFAGQAAVVYKWTDSDGVVHFSDQPVPGAEKITTGATNTAVSGSPGGSAKRRRSWSVLTSSPNRLAMTASARREVESSPAGAEIIAPELLASVSSVAMVD